MAQGTLDGFTGSSPKRASNLKRQSDGQYAYDEPDKKKPKTAAASSSRAQHAKNKDGDLGTKATAAELQDEMTETPYDELLRTIEEGSKDKIKPEGDIVVHWMRMKDLRLRDNRGLSAASVTARKENKHLMVLHVISPNDYKAHKRSARRIDFVLRNLKLIKEELDELNIPLHIITLKPRKTIPEKVVGYLKEIGASHLYANIEHEVDEARCLSQTYKLARKSNIVAHLLHDHCIVPPGKVTTKQGKPYSVFSPWYKAWGALVVDDPATYLDEVPKPEANDESARKHEKLQAYFKEEVPAEVQDYTLDPEEKAAMEKWWPAGAKAAQASLDHFVKTKKEMKEEEKDPELGAEDSDVDMDEDGVVPLQSYAENRSRADRPSTSRLSPYLAAGVISARQCLNATLPHSKNKLTVDKKLSIGNWVSEVSWRDFYQHVLANFPRVCMGKSFQPKMDAVVWEYNDEHLKAWKEGKTGYPFVDAGIRQMLAEGFMHNRARMNVGSFICKHLMLDWREGESYYMEKLIDGDFGSNNGGWGWVSSTGTDPQPYFRIFNPTTQGTTHDPNGDYIKKYVPELAKLSGKAVHEPYKHLTKKEFEKLGYPKPIVEHTFARKRAIARFKNPGERVDE